MSNYYLIIIYQKFRAFIPNRYNLKAGAFVVDKKLCISGCK